MIRYSDDGNNITINIIRLNGFTMKTFAKLAVVAFTFTILSGCTGTTYNQDKSCSADYLIHPAVSIPTIIGACEAK